MASLAASPVYPESLKKRARHADAFDLSRKRQRRGVSDVHGHDDAAVDADVPKYSQRHVDFFEQRHQAELGRLQAEYEQFLAKKDGEWQRLKHELQHAHERAALHAHDMSRLQGENRLLKRAVAIQKQQKDEVQREHEALTHLATQAAEHMKRLEQANYTLRVHLQTSTSLNVGPTHPPPDVY